MNLIGDAVDISIIMHGLTATGVTAVVVNDHVAASGQLRVEINLRVRG
jgi:hypothetical protein